MSPKRAEKVSGAYILRVISKNFRTINKKDPVDCAQKKKLTSIHKDLTGQDVTMKWPVPEISGSQVISADRPPPARMSLTSPGQE